MPEFPTDYPSILARLAGIDPAAYGRTRNYLGGAVTRLSPYLTHGVISTQDVGTAALAKANAEEAQVLLKELAWRDFYHASWSSLGDRILRDLRFAQPLGEFPNLPTAVLDGATGITAIDEAIAGLVATGYVHNHARMWIAMLCCNVGRTAWWNPSRWLYYHLLDGDIASNSLSWQWVAGSTRQEPYLANQENLNAFSGIIQTGTFLDVPYEELTRQIPPILRERSSLDLATHLEPTPVPAVSGEVLLYHPWSLSPAWQSGSALPRILLLEPDHFVRFPVSPRRLEFIRALAGNIPGLQIVVADFADLAATNPAARFRFVRYPAVSHWIGQAEERQPLYVCGQPVGADWSFTKFWSRASITIDPDASDE